MERHDELRGKAYLIGAAARCFSGQAADVGQLLLHTGAAHRDILQTKYSQWFALKTLFTRAASILEGMAVRGASLSDADKATLHDTVHAIECIESAEGAEEERHALGAALAQEKKRIAFLPAASLKR